MLVTCQLQHYYCSLLAAYLPATQNESVICTQPQHLHWATLPVQERLSTLSRFVTSTCLSSCYTSLHHVFVTHSITHFVTHFVTHFIILILIAVLVVLLACVIRVNRLVTLPGRLGCCLAAGSRRRQKGSVPSGKPSRKPRLMPRKSASLQQSVQPTTVMGQPQKSCEGVKCAVVDLVEGLQTSLAEPMFQSML